ncbi:MAG: 2-phospho-L-lactate transferase [Halieaceae bacterium]|nr:2-phospho-L-lactate transferase [Halieaceae bacterium]
MAESTGHIIAITGGVGGAKLSLGLADLLADGQLDVLVNTGDDFGHMGLHICPDVDTLLYTLAGRSNTKLGWGLEGESWNVMDALSELSGDTWFRLGDKDLATHLWRTQALASGLNLAEVTTALARHLGVAAKVHPMTQDPVRTIVHSEEGDLPFQHYFVRRHCEPQVRGFFFEGIESARPNEAVIQLLSAGVVEAVIICPSNPFVSIDPVLQVPGMWRALQACAAPVIAVSPIVAGHAIKGPAAKMMRELGVPATALAVAQYYGQRYPGLLDYFVIDDSDAILADSIRALDINVAITPTIMRTRKDKQDLARFVLQLVGQ